MKSSALVNFPYQHSTSGFVFPVVSLRLRFNQKVLDTTALVDSGASISVFRMEVAEYFGIKIESGKEIYLGGVGGRIKGYISEIDIELAGERFSCPIVFSHEYLTSLNLLGRQKVFERFTVIFEEKKQRLRFE